DEREQHGVTRGGGNGAMKTDVVHEERLRFAQRREHAGDFFGHRREAIGETALGGESGRADLEDLARFENLIARETVQRGEKTQGAGAEAGGTAGDERAGALSRLGDAHRGERVQSGTDGGPADAELFGELALGDEPIAGPQLAA